MLPNHQNSINKKFFIALIRIESMFIKAKRTAGQTFSRLSLRQLPLNQIIALFKIYVQPICLCKISSWMSSMAKATFKEIDIVWIRSLKRYLLNPSIQ